MNLVAQGSVYGESRNIALSLQLMKRHQLGELKAALRIAAQMDYARGINSPPQDFPE